MAVPANGAQLLPPDRTEGECRAEIYTPSVKRSLEAESKNWEQKKANKIRTTSDVLRMLSGSPLQKRLAHIIHDSHRI